MLAFVFLEVVAEIRIDVVLAVGGIRVPLSKLICLFHYKRSIRIY